jgi:hypothetical protein
LRTNVLFSASCFLSSVNPASCILRRQAQNFFGKFAGLGQYLSMKHGHSWERGQAARARAGETLLVKGGLVIR